MLISKFNRIIRSRLVWTILGGIFALSLVVFIGPNTDSCLPTASTGPVEGTVDGTPVSAQDFNQARMFEDLRSRDRSSATEEDQIRLRQRAWTRVAILHAAEAMGVTVSREEVASFVRNYQGFQRNGVFDKNLYTRIVAEQLRVEDPIGTFEESVRQDMIMRKAEVIIRSAVWVPASEINSKLNNITDQLTVQGAVLPRSRLVPVPTVTVEDARRLFDERPEIFRVPDRRAVRYVRFPLKDAEQPLPSDDDVRAYYDENAEKYQTSGTNGPVPIPIAEVRAEIVSNLQHRAAFVAASDRATTFDNKLQPDRRRRVPESIESLAAAEGVQVQTSRLFSASDRLPEFRSPGFAKAAFALEPGATQQADGENAVFVMALYTNVESHVPDFSNVVSRATALARDRRQSELFQAKCDEIRKAVADAVGAGKPFDDAVAPFRLAVTNFPKFSLVDTTSEEKDFENSDAVKPAVMSLQKGEVSNVIPVSNEDALVLFMKDRKPGDLLDAENIRPRLVANLNHYRGNLVVGEWQDYLTRAGALEDRAMKAQESGQGTSEQTPPPSPRKRGK